MAATEDDRAEGRRHGRERGRPALAVTDAANTYVVYRHEAGLVVLETAGRFDVAFDRKIEKLDDDERDAFLRERGRPLRLTL